MSKEVRRMYLDIVGARLRYAAYRGRVYWQATVGGWYGSCHEDVYAPYMRQLSSDEKGRLGLW